METKFNCGSCSKFLHSHLRNIRCSKCSLFYHVKCCNLTKKAWLNIQDEGREWSCENCIIKYENKNQTKCSACKLTIPKNKVEIKCVTCDNFFHSKCAKLTIKMFKKIESWQCNSCIDNTLPFSKLDNEKLKLTMQAKDINFGDQVNLSPSFTIQSLLDKIPGSINGSNEDFLSDTISSKYYTPSDFLTSKFNKSTFGMIHINIASLSLHIDDLKMLLDLLDHPWNVIGVSETKLREEHDPLINIKIDGYDFIQTSTKSFFGGVGLFVKNGIDYKIREDLNKSIYNVTESVFIEIKHNSNKNLLVGCIYRHHSSITEFVDSFLSETLAKIGKEKKKTIALLGDFNVDLLKFDDDINTGNFINLLSTYGFRPLVLQPTRVTSESATLIDNIYINDIEARSIGGNITFSISDHFPQFCILNIFEKKQKIKTVKYGRSYKHFNHDEFKNELNAIDWKVLFCNKNCDDSFSIFYKTIDELLDEMAPVRRLSKKEINLLTRPWITNGILKSIKDRDRTHKSYLKENNGDKKKEIYQLYKTKRNLIKILIRQSKRDYYVQFFEENKSDIKKTWEGIRNIVNVSKKERVVPVQLNYRNETKTNKKEMAQSFNEFFVGIGNMVEEKIPKSRNNFSEFLDDSNKNTIFLSPVGDDEVLSMISKLNSSKACGPNSIPCNLLKTHSTLLLEPLREVINMSIFQGSFPTLLKFAEVCPIYKKKDKDKCENYRPISLLSNLSKLFERAMHTRLYDFIESSDKFYDKQFGFRKKYSTNHALLSIVEGIRDKLDNKTFVCGVFIDLEKAFDTVNHQILLKKMEHYGVRGVANKWFASYLSSRKQKVKIDDAYSDFLDVTCGVPQGSILGPLLFLIYINDMRNAVKHSTIHHFADDTNLLCSDKDPSILRFKMNTDLKLIFEWLCANRLSLNVSKTEFIIFKPPKKTPSTRITLKLNGTTLYESNKIKYLGIVMDDKLTWKHHISELSKKISKSIGIIYKMRKMCPQRVQMSLYYSLVHSHLNYGACVWGNADEIHLNKVRLLQKKVIRTISNADFNEHSGPLFKNLNILKLEDLFKMQYACLMWEYEHGNLPTCFKNYFKKVSDMHNYETRNATTGKLSENIRVNTSTHGLTMLKFQGPKVFNAIKDFEFYNDSKSLYNFRHKYKSYLIDLYD